MGDYLVGPWTGVQLLLLIALGVHYKKKKQKFSLMHKLDTRCHTCVLFIKVKLEQEKTKSKLDGCPIKDQISIAQNQIT